ncbi:MAG: hypothetical protein AAGB02_02960 [Pseudomonadota bacterium]
MKTFLAIIGVLALGIIALIATLYVVSAQKLESLPREAIAYVDEAIPAIANNWDGEELDRRAAPELKALFTNGALEALMTAGERQLGGLTDYDTAECEMKAYDISADAGEVALVDCGALAGHLRGFAAYSVNLVKREGQWKIYGFYVFPSTTEEAPVQVNVALKDQRNINAVSLSLTDRSIGIISENQPAVGIGFERDEKIDNISD